jgi:hypothetical protein
MCVILTLCCDDKGKGIISKVGCLCRRFDRWIRRLFVQLLRYRQIFFFSRHCNPYGLWPAQLSLSILSRKDFTECRCQRQVKHQTWRTSD